MTITLWIPGIPVGVPRPRARHVESRKPFEEQLRHIQNLVGAKRDDEAAQALNALSLPEGFTHIYTPESGTFKLWRQALYLIAGLGLNRPAAELEGPLRLDLVFMMPRPACYSRKKDPEGPIWAPTNPNDWDNLGKVTDVLTKLHYWHDDHQVCDSRVRKCFHAKGGEPGALFVVARIDGEPNDLPREIPGMDGRRGAVGDLSGDLLAVVDGGSSAPVAVGGLTDTTVRVVPWPAPPPPEADGLVGINEGSPMCGVPNGQIMCCRQQGHPGRHATPYPGVDEPVWVRWTREGSWGTCHAGDPETNLYCCLETGHVGEHMAVSNRGHGVVLARWERRI